MVSPLGEEAFQARGVGWPSSSTLVRVEVTGAVKDRVPPAQRSGDN